MTDRDQQWRDDKLMALGGHFDGPLPGVSFVVPSACVPKGSNAHGDDTRAPGIYLRAHAPAGGPNITPRHAGRLLTREEALKYARSFDKFARPRPDCGDGDMFARGKPAGYYPATYEALVEAWYECLGRRLDLAVTEAEDRRAVLREARAAISGEVREAGQS